MTLTTAQKRDALCRTSAQRCYRWGGRYYVTITASRASTTNGPIVLDAYPAHEGKTMTRRVAVYVDGFNLYYGLRSKGWRRYYWLDLRRLSEQFLRARQRLVLVRYFTAGVFAEPHDPDKPVRQNTYLEALGTLPNLHIHKGYFFSQTATLRSLRRHLANLRGEDHRREHRG